MAVKVDVNVCISHNRLDVVLPYVVVLLIPQQMTSITGVVMIRCVPF